MKNCFKCGERKTLSDFYKHSKMADGHVNKCKECNKKYIRDNRKSKVDYYRMYDRGRGSRQTREYASLYKDEYPKNSRAITMVNNAVRDGRLEKAKFCSECGNNEFSLHGHHDDYSYPMVVRWLCPACHKAWHARMARHQTAGRFAAPYADFHLTPPHACLIFNASDAL